MKDGLSEEVTGKIRDIDYDSGGENDKEKK